MRQFRLALVALLTCLFVVNTVFLRKAIALLMCGLLSLNLTTCYVAFGWSEAATASETAKIDLTGTWINNRTNFKVWQTGCAIGESSVTSIGGKTGAESFEVEITQSGNQLKSPPREVIWPGGYMTFVLSGIIKSGNRVILTEKAEKTSLGWGSIKVYDGIVQDNNTIKGTISCKSSEESQDSKGVSGSFTWTRKASKAVLKPDLVVSITKWENIIPGVVGWPKDDPNPPEWTKPKQSEVDNGWAVNLTAVVTVKILNQGDVDAPASILSMKLKKNDKNQLLKLEPKSASIESLKPGQEFLSSVKLTFDPTWDFFGEASIIAEVDNENLISETNKSNNRSAREILLADPRPDRWVEKVFESEEKAKAHIREIGFFWDPINKDIGETKALSINPQIKSRRDGKLRPGNRYRQDAIIWRYSEGKFLVVIQGTPSFGEPNPNFPESWSPYLYYVRWWHKNY